MSPTTYNFSRFSFPFNQTHYVGFPTYLSPFHSIYSLPTKGWVHVYAQMFYRWYSLLIYFKLENILDVFYGLSIRGIFSFDTDGNVKIQENLYKFNLFECFL